MPQPKGRGKGGGKKTQASYGRPRPKGGRESEVIDLTGGMMPVLTGFGQGNPFMGAMNMGVGMPFGFPIIVHRVH